MRNFWNSMRTREKIAFILNHLIFIRGFGAPHNFFFFLFLYLSYTIMWCESWNYFSMQQESSLWYMVMTFNAFKWFFVPLCAKKKHRKYSFGKIWFEFFCLICWWIVRLVLGSESWLSQSAQYKMCGLILNCGKEKCCALTAELELIFWCTITHKHTHTLVHRKTREWVTELRLKAGDSIDTLLSLGACA